MAIAKGVYLWKSFLCSWYQYSWLSVLNYEEPCGYIAYIHLLCLIITWGRHPLSFIIVHSGMAVTGATESSRLLAALSLGEEDQSRILDASRALATAMAALLNASRPENYNKVNCDTWHITSARNLTLAVYSVEQTVSTLKWCPWIRDTLLIRIKEWVPFS